MTKEIREHLFHWVRPRVGSEEDAEDLVQDVMERMVRHQAAKGPGAIVDPQAFLWRSMRNALTDHYRRRATKPASSPLVEEAGLPVEGLSLPREVVLSCMALFVDQLDPVYREALMLTDLGSLSQLEASRQLGIGYSAMKSRVQRGRQMVLQELTRCCQVELDRRGGLIGIQGHETCSEC